MTRRLGPFLLALVITITCIMQYLIVTKENAKEDLRKQKSISKTYYDQAVLNQLNYERTLEDLNHARLALEQDKKLMADYQERLAQAAERDRAANVRASRSRRAATLSAQQSVHPSSDRMFSGALRDITMYCPTGNSTASGKRPVRGMVATISRSIPFGTRVVIEGLGTYTVEDRIGHGSEFDIFTPSCSEADRFGRQHRHVTILG